MYQMFHCFLILMLLVHIVFLRYFTPITLLTLVLNSDATSQYS